MRRRTRSVRRVGCEATAKPRASARSRVTALTRTLRTRGTRAPTAYAVAIRAIPSHNQHLAFSSRSRDLHVNFALVLQSCESCKSCLKPALKNEPARFLGRAVSGRAWRPRRAARDRCDYARFRRSASPARPSAISNPLVGSGIEPANVPCVPATKSDALIVNVLDADSVPS